MCLHVQPLPQLWQSRLSKFLICVDESLKEKYCQHLQWDRSSPSAWNFTPTCGFLNSHCTSHHAIAAWVNSKKHDSPIGVSRIVSRVMLPLSLLALSFLLSLSSRDILSHRPLVLSSLALLPSHYCHALSSFAPSSLALSSRVIALLHYRPCTGVSHATATASDTGRGRDHFLKYIRALAPRNNSTMLYFTVPGIVISHTVLSQCLLILSPCPCIVLVWVPKNNPVIFVNAILHVVVM